MTTMPHACEVTADRLGEVARRHLGRLTKDEQNAVAVVRLAFLRIADEDRARLAKTTKETPK